MKSSIDIKNAKAGSWVSINQNLEGEVMFCAASDSYSVEYPKEDWPQDTYDGILIRQENGALIFHDTILFDSGELIICLI